MIPTELRRRAVRSYTIAKRWMRDDVFFLPRRRNSKDRVLPDFLILGGMKCGTTSLSYYLSQHPHILDAYKKEIRYFDKRSHRGLDWYRAHFPLRTELRAAQLRTDATILTGEATPNYLFHPCAPRRIFTALPDVKLIAILRNPIERAFSHYNHNRREERTFGQDPEPLSFIDALRTEEDRLRGHAERMLADPAYVGKPFLRFSYMHQGIYVDQLARYEDLYGKERILVLRSEDFYRDTQNSLNIVSDFLGLDRFTPADLQARNVNQYATMDPEARGFMERFFVPHNQRLNEYLNRDMQWS